MQKLTKQIINCFLWNLRERNVEVRSVYLYQDGEVLLMQTYSPFQKDGLHPVYSISKSFLAAAIGWLIEEGKIRLEDTWISYFPEYADSVQDEQFNAVTIRDLLTMSLGQEREAPVTGDDDWVQRIIEEPIVKKPGSEFFYNSQASYLLGVLVERASEKKYMQYLEEKIFAPLGITEYQCETDKKGNPIAGLCLHLKTEDIGKFGVALLENGNYQGKTVIPEWWVKEVGKKQLDNADVIPPEKIEDCQGYGYHFWLCSQGGYRCSGLYGQLCYIWPEQKVVLACNSATTGNGAILACFYDALKEAGSEETILEKKQAVEFSDFRILPVQSIVAAGDSAAGKVGNYLCGTYEAQENIHGVDRLTISTETSEHMSKSIYHVEIVRNGKIYEFRAADGEWLKQEDHFATFTPHLYHGAMDPAYHEAFRSPALYGSYGVIGEEMTVRLQAHNFSGSPWFCFHKKEDGILYMHYRIDAYLTNEPEIEVIFH